MGWYSHDWRPYVSVAERRRKATKLVAKMRKKGRNITPVEIVGRKITTTFWGNAWCKNLEAYSDFANRLPRGRTYVRNGSVIDLQVQSGRVQALVSGSDIYEVDITFKRLPKKRWADIKGQCSGQIGSLVELLQGSISKGVMEIVTRKGQGLFPSPQEISLSCSCPDWATMCKHVAAVLYGVGAHLDHKPELLFTLRGVDPMEMVEAAVEQPPTARKPRRGPTLRPDELSSVFGVDIDMGQAASADVAARAKPRRQARRAGGTKRKTSKRNVRKSATKPTAKKKTVSKKKASKKPLTKKASSRRTTAKKSDVKKTRLPKTARKKRMSKKKRTIRKVNRTPPKGTT